MRKPSQRSIDLYNQLVESQNQIRKTLTRIHRQAEEAFGAGRLPSLVIPKKARKIRMSDFQGMNKIKLQQRLKMFWARYRESKRLFSQGLRSYIARTVKDGYMELWRDQILFNSGESPEGKFSKFTQEQIENSYMGEFMDVYNKLISLPAEAFLAMLYKGKIIQFKYIYEDMILGTGGKENSWLQQQKELLSLSRKDIMEDMDWVTENGKPKKQVYYSNVSDYDDKKAHSYSGQHSDKTVNEAKQKLSRKRR